jgi:ATP-dependent Zn protease
MNAADEAAPVFASHEERHALSYQWRVLTRAATAVAVLTSPAAFLWFHREAGWGVGWSLLAAAGVVIGFRGFVDLTLRRFIPWPSLFGTDDKRIKEDDIVNRRRAWFWHRLARLGVYIVALITFVWLVQTLKHGSASWPGAAGDVWHAITLLKRSGIWTQLIIVPVFFLANFLIFLGPMMLMGITQIRGYEPGDADWGVQLDDVRGQAEAKEEVRRVVNLWQSGEAFEKAGGKRERGLLFLGAPGTGKTMLAKALATGFNSPFVTIPGSGFAQTFIGIDAIIVRYLARKAKKLAAKWGGQCIVFIDEIDAVGMRRQALQGGTPGTMSPGSFHDFCFYGPYGALNPSGDLILETRAWRERLFEQRAPERSTTFLTRLWGIVTQGFPGGVFGGGMGQLALNQLLITMDGIDNPPFWRRFWTNRVNTILDASYVVPRRVGDHSLRLPRPRPSGAQIYFIGATNVPIQVLDPALTRPGRMGRHVWFRTPTKKDREDIFELYLGKVAHEPDLDAPERREELARITNGYSPAMIEQVCSMALTHAHHELREAFGWEHIVEAMTTVESGTAVGVEYIPEETRATAIHEAGHAVAGHVFMKGVESTRLSIRMRGGSLGHHQALEKDERFSRWRSEEFANLVWTLGAMAAEQVFYGENTNGVGGDLHSATTRAGVMVGMSGMGPSRPELNGGFKNDGEREAARKRLMERFEEIGNQLMNRSGAGGPADIEHNPIGAVLTDRYKRAIAAQILGQAYVEAYNVVRVNKDAVDRIADTLVERRELYGNELVALLDSCKLKKPELDLTAEETWPTL